MICYPAVIEYDRADDAYNVSFPNLPGCLTFGRTLDAAQENAREALSAYLESIDSRKLKVPASSEIVGDNVGHASGPDRRPLQIRLVASLTSSRRRPGWWRR